MRFALVACLFPLVAAANPTGGAVTSGSATISSSGSTLTVNTTSAGTVINWTAFSIGSGETTRFNQPTSASVTLNRVTGPSSSSINGSLQSNGQVFLVNPNGIVFGSTASVNVAGFVASTLDITDADFLSGNLRFAASGTTGSVATGGSIVAADYVALIGAAVSLPSGTINAGAGGIVVAAGAPVTLTTAGGVFTSASIGLGIPGAVITFGGGVFNSDGPIIFQTGGGSSLPHIPIPVPPVIVGPSSGQLTINPGNSGGVINWQGFSTGSSGTVNISYGTLSATTTTTGGTGNVSIQGTLTQAGSAPAVTTTGVALNLEKREFSF